MDIFDTNPFVDLLTVGGGKGTEVLARLNITALQNTAFQVENATFIYQKGRSYHSPCHNPQQQVDKKQCLLLHVPTLLNGKSTVFAFCVFSTKIPQYF